MWERFDCSPPIVERVALTKAQIKEHRLPTRPTKREGNRHAKDFTGRCVELDALQPRVLRGMVHKVIKRHISARALAILRETEDSDRELLRAWRGRL
jgi:hypothetical protein